MKNILVAIIAATLLSFGANAQGISGNGGTGIAGNTNGGGSGGSVSISGTPTAAQYAEWTNASTIKGTSFGSGVKIALGIAVGSAGAPVVLNGVGGTPSSLTGTNIIGTASGLTAGNVTTNHSITVSGDCTGSGANSIALTCSGGGGTGANPTATAGPTAINGVAMTFVRSDGAPAIQLATSAQKGIAQVDGQTIVAASGVISTAAPIRTAATPTVATTDMGGTIFVSSGTITIPAITTSLFDAKQTLLLVNYSGSTEAISTTPTINAGGNCVSGTGIPAGYAWALQSNNTTLDCVQLVSAAAAGAVTGVSNSDGTLTISPTTGAVVASIALGHANTWSGQQTFVAPVLGTVAAGSILTNATGLPISTGVSGLGTGVATAAAIATNAAGGVGTIGTSGATVGLLNGTNTFSGTQTFGAVVGGVNIQTGTTYTLAATDCGRTVHVSNGSAITVTTFQAAVVGCVINVVQGGAGQITFANGGSATLISAHSYTKTFAAAGATVSLAVYVNAGSAAVFTLTGDGA